MDSRLYILAGSFLFLVLSLVILIAAMARARKASSSPVEPAVAGPWPMLNPAPPSAVAAARGTFSEPTTGVAAVLNEPIRTGSWRPETPPSPPKAAARSDYWDSLVAEPDLLLREGAAVHPAPAQVPETTSPPTPVNERPVEEVAEEAPDVAPASGEAPALNADAAAVPEPQLSATPLVDTENVAVVVDRAQQDAEIDHLIEVLVEVPPEAPLAEAAIAELTPPTRPVRPSPPSAPTPPTVASAPQVTKPPAEMIAATEPPVAETSIQDSVPAAPPAAPRPAVVAKTARVTAAATVRPATPARADVPTARRAATQSERPRATVARTKSDDAPTHELVAPVEMWFGDDRVGVKPGSRTYDLFQKYATVLFDDLRRSRSSTLV